MRSIFAAGAALLMAAALTPGDAAAVDRGRNTSGGFTGQHKRLKADQTSRQPKADKQTNKKKKNPE